MAGNSVSNASDLAERRAAIMSCCVAPCFQVWAQRWALASIISKGCFVGPSLVNISDVTGVPGLHVPVKCPWGLVCHHGHPRIERGRRSSAHCPGCRLGVALSCFRDLGQLFQGGAGQGRQGGNPARTVSWREAQEVTFHVHVPGSHVHIHIRTSQATGHWSCPGPRSQVTTSCTQSQFAQKVQVCGQSAPPLGNRIGNLR